jgi:hypothetical protein
MKLIYLVMQSIYKHIQLIILECKGHIAFIRSAREARPILKLHFLTAEERFKVWSNKVKSGMAEKGYILDLDIDVANEKYRADIAIKGDE